jgi:predicted dehydrogenase
MAKIRPGKPRLGLVGTGVWARTLHAPTAAESDDIAFTSIFGRNEPVARDLASTFQVQAYTDFPTFLDSVDIVAFALTPDAQSAFALAAADAGKHLLLEKPVARDHGTANEIADRLERRGSASVVFFTQLLLPRVKRWVDDAAAAGGWLSARVESFAQTLSDPTNPFYPTDWRRRLGALWDVAPHSVALLCLVLGDVVEVAAMRSREQLVQLTLSHSTGTISSVVATLDARVALPGSTVLFGVAGANVLPPSLDWYVDAKNAYRLALAWLSAAAQGASSPIRLDARFGAHITAILAAAERSIDSGQRIRL